MTSDASITVRRRQLPPAAILLVLGTRLLRMRMLQLLHLCQDIDRYGAVPCVGVAVGGTGAMWLLRPSKYGCSRTHRWHRGKWQEHRSLREGGGLGTRHSKLMGGTWSAPSTHSPHYRPKLPYLKGKGSRWGAALSQSFHHVNEAVNHLIWYVWPQQLNRKISWGVSHLENHGSFSPLKLRRLLKTRRL